MRRFICGLGLVAVVLGGCGWLVPQPAALFPEEIVAGWRKTGAAELALEDLPVGAVGGAAAAWERGESWIWAQVVTMGERSLGCSPLQRSPLLLRCLRNRPDWGPGREVDP